LSSRGGGSASLEDAAPPGSIEIHHVLFPTVAEDGEFGDIVGQKALVRALQLAAAGGHNLIAVGAPGCGKTMALQKFPALLPVLTPEEAQPVTRILSLAGLLPPSEPLVRIPPFRMPHQTASIEGMCGGGPQCRPGEISLAHNGVLFLDEAAEFKTSVLQMLRVPMESGSVTLCRAGRSTVFPANFQLLMAANPCPCGNYGSEAKLCLCSARSIELYWKKFSAPLLDRIDIRVSVENENGAGRRSDSHGFRSSAEAGAFLERRDCRLTTAALREEVARAVFMQRTRQGKRNAKLSAGEVAEHCALYGAAEQALDAAVGRYGLSPRAVSSCRKVARTAADMAGRTDISAADIREAVFFRQSFCNLMDL
ncbi:MAG: ATP-binding protein, partial [Treponemataceae bacterium]|nr:ATP-binding protein [Treponemataceae bacterium]